MCFDCSEKTVAPTGQPIRCKARKDGQGIVAHVPPLHRVVIDKVLEILQKYSHQENGDDHSDFLTSVPRKKQQDRSACEREEMDLPVHGAKRLRPGRLQGAGDQEQQPRYGASAYDLCAIQFFVDGELSE